jgi:transcriptional regulator with XRE-family HTH domain
MPDYNVIQKLCDELGVSISELMDAEENEPDSIRTYDEEQILDLIKRTQNLENQRTSLYGIILIVLGITLFVLHYQVNGSAFRDLCSGVLLGLSIGINITGVIITVSGIVKQKK